MQTATVVGVAIMLVLLGLLLGWSWAVQAYGRRSRDQARAQRELNEGWQRLRAARRSLDRERHPDR